MKGYDLSTNSTERGGHKFDIVPPSIATPCTGCGAIGRDCYDFALGLWTECSAAPYREGFLPSAVPDPEIIFRLVKPTCECGAAKALNAKDGAPGHSQWCPVAAK